MASKCDRVLKCDWWIQKVHSKWRNAAQKYAPSENWTRVSRVTNDVPSSQRALSASESLREYLTWYEDDDMLAKLDSICQRIEANAAPGTVFHIWAQRHSIMGHCIYLVFECTWYHVILYLSRFVEECSECQCTTLATNRPWQWNQGFTPRYVKCRWLIFSQIEPVISVFFYLGWQLNSFKHWGLFVWGLWTCIYEAK